MLVRVKGDSRTMLPLLRQEIVAVDPNVAISEALPLSGLIENMYAEVPLAMRVIGYARSPREVPSADFASVSTDYAEVARNADFVSLHIPGSPDNAQFMNAERLAALPARAWLINTARGAVVDEPALHDALASGRLAGAALDVFAREPYQPARADRDLRTLPNVILVPHIGSNTVEANRRMAGRALRNIRLAIDGELAAMDLINREVLWSGNFA